MVLLREAPTLTRKVRSLVKCVILSNTYPLSGGEAVGRAFCSSIDG